MTWSRTCNCKGHADHEHEHVVTQSQRPQAGKLFEYSELLVTVIGPGRVVRDQFRTKKTHHGRAAGLVETGTKIKTSDVTPTDGAGTKCSPQAPRSGAH